MKIIVIFFSFFLIQIAGFGQRYSIEININSTQFSRVFDGFLLQEDCLISRDVDINNIRRVSDRDQLTKMGLKDFSKPYMFLNTTTSSIREFIYQKASKSTYVHEMNFPIILNGKVITYCNYDLLDRLDSSAISGVTYLLPDESFLIKHPDMPLGAVAVLTTRHPLKRKNIKHS